MSVSSNDKKASGNNESEASFRGGIQLALLDNGNIRAVFHVSANRLVIGRSESCDIVLNDPLASNRHAEVFIESGHVVIRDRSSRNGTRVNEQRVKAQYVQPGDIIRIGRSVLMCLRPDMPIAGDDKKAEGFVEGVLPDAGRMSLPVTEQRPLIIGSAEEANIRIKTTDIAEFEALITTVPGGALIIGLSAIPLKCSFLLDGQALTFGPVTLSYRCSQLSGKAKRPSQQNAAGPAPGAKQEISGENGRRQLGAGSDLSDDLWEEANYAERVTLKPSVVPTAKEPAPSGMWMLTGTLGPNKGRDFQIAAEEFTIGRSVRCSLFLEGEDISRRHARIVVKDDEIEIEDLKSANGIFVNDQHVIRYSLRAGDRIRIGGNEFLLHMTS